MTPETAAYDHSSPSEAEPWVLAHRAALEGTRARRRRFDMLLCLSVGWLVVITLASAFASFLPLASPNETVGRQ